MTAFWQLTCSVMGPQAVALKEDGLTLSCVSSDLSSRLPAYTVSETPIRPRHPSLSNGDLKGKPKHGRLGGFGNLNQPLWGQGR